MAQVLREMKRKKEKGKKEKEGEGCRVKEGGGEKKEQKKERREERQEGREKEKERNLPFHNLPAVIYKR